MRSARQRLARSSGPRTAPIGWRGEPPGAEDHRQSARGLLRAADRVPRAALANGPKFPTPTYLDLLLAAADVLPSRRSEHGCAFARRLQLSRDGSRRRLRPHRRRVSPLLRSTPLGRSRTSKRCSTTRASCCGSTRRSWRRSGRCDEALSLADPRNRHLSPARDERPETAASTRASTPTARAKRESSTSGSPTKLPAYSARQRAAAFDAAYGVTGCGKLRRRLRRVLRETSAPIAAAASRRSAKRCDKRETRDCTRHRSKTRGGLERMLISGLARAASKPPRRRRMLDDAVASGGFRAGKLLIDDDGRLLRTYERGRAHVPGFLDDLAGMLEACLDLQRAGAGERFFAAAAALRGRRSRPASSIEEASDLFLTPSDGEPLVVRPRSDHDGATPHSTGLATMGLLRATPRLRAVATCEAFAERVLRTHASRLERTPEALPTSGARRARRGARPLGGRDRRGSRSRGRLARLAARARACLRPEDAVLVVSAELNAPPSSAPNPAIRAGCRDGRTHRWTTPIGSASRNWCDGQPAAYVCRGVECSLPALSPDELATL